MSTGGASPRLTVGQAAFIGVGAMVGAGIFSQLGAAGEVAGSAVWLSFLIAGAIAGLQAYSFAKFGARYPTAGGLLEYVRKGYGDGHFLGIIAWLILAANAIVTRNGGRLVRQLCQRKLLRRPRVPDEDLCGTADRRHDP